MSPLLLTLVHGCVGVLSRFENANTVVRYRRKGYADRATSVACPPFVEERDTRIVVRPDHRHPAIFTNVESPDHIAYAVQLVRSLPHGTSRVNRTLVLFLDRSLARAPGCRRLVNDGEEEFPHQGPPFGTKADPPVNQGLGLALTTWDRAM